VRVRGFKFVLVTCCLAVAVVAWLTTVSRPERVLVSVIAVAAAVTLLLVARTSSVDPDFEAGAAVDPVSADVEAESVVEVEPRAEMQVETQPEMGSESPESPRWRLGSRRGRRLVELESQLERVGELLRVQEQAMVELAETVGRLEVESSEGITRLEQRLDGLAAENVEQRSALHSAYEMHRRQVGRFQDALAVHKQGLAGLSETLDTASSPAA
jgi:hypothetical protein